MRLDSIQTLRAAAALSVVFFHISLIFSNSKYFGVAAFHNAFGWGTHGVDLFFVISGFVMGHVHYEDFMKSRGASRFLASRISRIYFPYWPVLAIAVAIYFLMPALSLEGRDARDPLTIVRSALLLPGTNGDLDVAWTLEHEVTFYAVIFLALLNRPLGIAVFALWQLASIGTVFGASAFSTAGPLEIEFVLGLACAMIFRFKPTIQFPLILFALGVLLFLGLGWWESYQPFQYIGWVRSIGYGAASSLIVVGSVFAERAGRFRVGPIALLLGNASYAIYLVHYDLLLGGVRMLRTLKLTQPEYVSWLAALTAVLLIGVGCLYHVAIEKRLVVFGRTVFSESRRQFPTARI